MPLNIKNTYYETLPEKFFTRLELEGSECPELLIFNERLAIELEFTEEEEEEIKDELMQKIRYLDKLIDELAKGKPMDKILRS